MWVNLGKILILNILPKEIDESRIQLALSLPSDAPVILALRLQKEAHHADP